MAPRPLSSKRKDTFRKRNRTVGKKANELAKCGAKVYLVVQFCGQFHIYTSHTSAAWPPDRDQIVSTYGTRSHAQLTFCRLKATHCPNSWRPPISSMDRVGYSDSRASPVQTKNHVARFPTKPR